jgi:hypothetical protein
MSQRLHRGVGMIPGQAQCNEPYPSWLARQHTLARRCRLNTTRFSMPTWAMFTAILPRPRFLYDWARTGIPILRQ